MRPVGNGAGAVAAASIGITLGVGLLLALARTGARDPLALGIFRHLLLYQDYYAVAPFAAILVLAVWKPLQRRGAGLARWCAEHPWTTAGLTSATLAAGAHVVYHTHPLAMDEYAPLFQSRVFAAGSMTAHFPPGMVGWLIPPFLQGVFFKVDPAGTVVSTYWPGFALLLAPFTAVGVPWLLNPLIGGATVLVVHRLACALSASRLAAGYAVLFTLASPAVTINALSYYSMPAHMLANGLFALLVLGRSAWHAALAGAIGSAALVLHNPVPHLLFSLPWIAWLSTQPHALRRLAALAAGYLPLSVGVGLGWAIFYRTFGTAVPAADLATPGAAAELAGQALGRLLTWPSQDVVAARLWGMAKLWLWASPALLVAAALALARARQLGTAWLALSVSAGLTLLFYFFVPYDQGHGWGYRYFHSAWLVLPLLAAAATTAPATPGRPHALGAYLAACALLSLVIMTPLRAWQIEQFVSRHLDQRPRSAAGMPGAIFIRPQAGYYAWDLVQNDPFLRNRPLLLLSLGMERDRALMASRFPSYKLLYADERGSVWGGTE